MKPRLEPIIYMKMKINKTRLVEHTVILWRCVNLLAQEFDI
jgi:hypothetical protein